MSAEAALYIGLLGNFVFFVLLITIAVCLVKAVNLLKEIRDELRKT